VRRATIASSFLRSYFAPWPFISDYLPSPGVIAFRSPFPPHNSLASVPDQSDRCLDAVITAKGANTMNTPNIETEATAQAVTPVAEPIATKKATRNARKPGVALGKGKSGKKASKAEKAPKKPKGAKPAKSAESARKDSKAAKVLDLLKRPGGTTLAELMKATNWQAHSVRGFLSGTVGKKLGLRLESTKAENGERTYSIKG
jgi:hypothetical protein